MQTRNWTKKALAALSVTLLPLSLGCDPIECGDGTTEVDGECAPAEAQVPEESCGPGTVLMDGRCVALTAPTTCGENTFEIEDPDNPGSFICVGVGNCEADLLCTNPTVPDSITVCGRVQDIGTGSYTQRGNDTDTTPCTAEDDGTPCEFILQLQGSDGAGGTVPLATAPTYLDACGRFRFENVAVNPSVFVPFGSLVVANPNTGNEGGRVATATATALPAVGAADGGNIAFSLSGDTITAWATDAAGDPNVDMGLIAGIPTSGAMMLRFLNPSAGGPASFPASMTNVLQYDASPATDAVPYATTGDGTLYHFEDVPPAGVVTALNPSGLASGQTSTGANGWALIPDHTQDGTTKFWAAGGEAATCNGTPVTPGGAGAGIFLPAPLPTPQMAGVVTVLPLPLVQTDQLPSVVLCDL